MNYLAQAITRATPHVTEIPENLTLPSAVKKAQAAMSKAYDEWADAENQLAVAQLDVETALMEFDESIKAAARQGKPVPASVNVADLENQVKYLAELERVTRGVVDKAEQTLQDEIRTHRVAIAEALIETVEAGIEAHAVRVKKLAADVEGIENARRKAYEGLYFFAHFTDPELRYSFDAGNDDVKLPTIHETNARNVVATLRRFIDQVADGGQAKQSTPVETLVETLA